MRLPSFGLICTEILGHLMSIFGSGSFARLALQRIQNARKLMVVSGLLRNSTIFRCAKKLGLEQSSRKTPASLNSLKATALLIRGGPTSSPRLIGAQNSSQPTTAFTQSPNRAFGQLYFQFNGAIIEPIQQRTGQKHRGLTCVAPVHFYR